LRDFAKYLKQTTNQGPIEIISARPTKFCTRRVSCAT